MRIVLPLVLVLAVTGCTSELPTSHFDGDEGSSETVAAKKQLRGALLGYFNPGFFADPVNIPSYYGTVTIDEVVYGIVFYSRGSGKPYPELVRGRSFHFSEEWALYTWIDFDFDTQTLTTGDLLMEGTDQGLTHPNGKFHSQGRVTGAYGSFSDWLGRHNFGSGTLTFDPATGFPITGVGEIRWF